MVVAARRQAVRHRPGRHDRHRPRRGGPGHAHGHALGGDDVVEASGLAADAIRLQAAAATATTSSSAARARTRCAARRTTTSCSAAPASTPRRRRGQQHRHPGLTHSLRAGGLRRGAPGATSSRRREWRSRRKRPPATVALDRGRGRRLRRRRRDHPAAPRRLRGRYGLRARRAHRRGLDHNTYPALPATCRRTSTSSRSPRPAVAPLRPQAEIQAYLEEVARRHGVMDGIRTATEV